MNVNLYALDKEQLKKVKSVPSSLNEAMDALESDHKFLLEGDVFTKELIDMWIDYKKTKEIDPVRLRPHPWEYYLYYDI